MSKRWYDSYPALSMAISLLQNTTPEYREQAITYLEKRINALIPNVTELKQPENPTFWAFLQKRKSMDTHDWEVVETMRFLSEEDKDTVGIEMIRFIYQLEHEEDGDLVALMFPELEAAI